MIPAKADVFARLQKEILAIQGFKPAVGQAEDASGLGRIVSAFPNAVFPYAGVHEFIYNSRESAAASGAFVTALLSGRMKKGGVAIWISTGQSIYPPALISFGVQPAQIIFLQLKKDKEVIWAVEEALQCPALTAVITEIPELGFTASRRFQLAIEKSDVGCFVLRHRPKNMATASLSRWQVQPMASVSSDVPGVHHPCWKVELLKVRNGKPGAWELQWSKGKFRHLAKVPLVSHQLHRKTG